MASNPEDVHPEYDHPLPENMDEWSEEQLNRFNELKRQELEAESEANRAELADKTADAIETLRSLGQDTAIVDLADLDDRVDESVEIEVRTELTGDLERKAVRYNGVDISTELDYDEQVSLALDVLEGLVVGPDGYDEREAWRQLWEQRGFTFLDQCLDALMAPMLERDEDAKN